MATPNERGRIDSKAFRKTMGLFATGVTVMAAEADGEIFGMTANAITSVSLEPLLILVCVEKTGKIVDYLRKSGRFSISILSEEQEDLSRFFANMWTEPKSPAFTFIPWVGAPRLAETIGAIACEITEFVEGGDHWIVIGRVLDLHYEENPPNPLLFYAGEYRQILEPAEVG